jgi:hypothetical protein
LKEDRKMCNLRSIIFYSVIVLVLNLIIGDEIMPFGSLSEGIPGPPGPQGEPGPAGPGTFTEETKIIVVDDYPSIQDAINDAPQGSTVYFPVGNYTITAPITVTKKLSLIGAGIKTQIYQSTDNDLFVLTGPYNDFSIRDLCLGSEATTAGKCLIKLDNVHYGHIERVWLCGAYYGIHLYGAIGNMFYGLANIYASQFFHTTLPEAEYLVYGERAGGKSINHTSFFATRLQNGIRGIHITDSANEGGVLIHGGLVEGMSTEGIYLGGITEFFSIDGMHLESENSGIELNNCKNGSVRNCYVGSDAGVRLYQTKNTLVEGGYFKYITTDAYCQNITIRNLFLGNEPTIRGSDINVENVTLSMSVLNGPSGLYTPSRSGRNLVDGIMEAWADGVPIGFSGFPAASSVSQESTIVKFGNYSAKVQVQAGETSAAMRYALDYDRIVKPFLKNYNSADYKWTLSNGGTSEYYCELAAGGDPGISLEPRAVFLDNSTATKGTIGSLSPGTWGYGKNAGDSLSFNTLYVRTSSSTDPDSEASGYVEGQWQLPQLTVRAYAYKPETNGVNPRIAIRYADTGQTLSKAITIPTDEWTPITVTFYLDPGRNGASVFFWTRISGGSPGDVCYFDGIEIVEGTIASPIYDDSRGTMGDFRVGGRMITSTITTFSNGDASPSVSNGNIFKTANTSTTTITTFDGGVAGQEIKVIFGDNKTNIDFTGTNLKGNGGTDWSPLPGDHMTCIFDGTNWYCDVSDNTQ